MRITILTLLFVFSLSACNTPPSEGQLLEAIKTAEKNLYGDKKNFTFNADNASALIETYNNFAKALPNHAQTPEYLFKSAELYRSIKKFDEAIGCYQNIVDSHNGYEKAPHSLFLLGFTYEKDLKKMDKAKGAYEQFLKEYPKHELADDVEFSLQHLGKSPEEIIKEFEENSKKQLIENAEKEEAATE